LNVPTEIRRAQIVGTGLIGGSVGAALRKLGWLVSGVDIDPERASRALEVGVVDHVGVDPDAAVVFVATPAGSVAEVAAQALRDCPAAVVSDVAGVKRPVVEALPEARFVGGHPMAGSEQDGVEGADPEMFEGATWVLTPSVHTDPACFAFIRSLVGSFGANVVELPAARHDELVALVSHVPHLTAAALMNLAAETASEHATLLRLAAGGFRDMTRIAAGEASIWPDVCAANKEAVVGSLDRLLHALAQLRELVAAGDRAVLLDLLERARHARVNLPASLAPSSQTAELRVPVPDRPGVLAEVTTLLGEMGINIYDLEIAHSVEGDKGVLVLVVAEGHCGPARQALAARGYRSFARVLEK